MALRLATVVLDVRDLRRSAAFWSAALQYQIASMDDEWASLSHPTSQGPRLGLQPRDDAKTEVNRVHLDLAAEDVQGEVRRLEGLGARRAAWPYYPKDANWIVMEDPDGNEFCVVPA